MSRFLFISSLYLLNYAMLWAAAWFYGRKETGSEHHRSPMMLNRRRWVFPHILCFTRHPPGIVVAWKLNVCLIWPQFVVPVKVLVMFWKYPIFYDCEGRTENAFSAISPKLLPRIIFIFWFFEDSTKIFVWSVITSVYEHEDLKNGYKINYYDKKNNNKQTKKHPEFLHISQKVWGRLFLCLFTAVAKVKLTLFLIFPCSCRRGISVHAQCWWCTAVRGQGVWRRLPLLVCWTDCTERCVPFLVSVRVWPSCLSSELDWKRVKQQNDRKA